MVKMRPSLQALFLGFCSCLVTSSSSSWREPANNFAFYDPSPKDTGCGYASCTNTREGFINVHLVPHSHDDVGWLKSLDEYYYGDKMEIQRAGVQYILDSVMKELALDRHKRFIQVETAFFWRWWNEQSDQMQNLVRDLVAEGRLEFIGGGWSMNDEAATHYTGIIDNMAIGLQELQEHFGDCGVPNVAWQIDPFGHSKEQANLFAKMGFDALFFARIDYRDKQQRKESKTLQTVWSAGSTPNDESSSIFTGAFQDHYSAPRGFCYDMRCLDREPINDDANIKNNNLNDTLELFQTRVAEELSFFKNQEHIMFTMGDDFTYQNAGMYYKNLDKLIRYMNERSDETGIHVFYSTPSCYIKALNEAGETWPEKSDDFFPYASDENSYWSGYFTSRSAFKLHERVNNAFLQSARQLDVNLGLSGRNDLMVLARALGAAQHHDAITGTAKAPVDDDYHQRLSKGHLSAQTVMSQGIFQDLSNPPLDLGVLYTCPWLNVSSCYWTTDALQDSNVLMSVYNPRLRTQDVYARIPLNEGINLNAIGDSGTLSVEYVTIPSQVQAIPGRNSEATQEAIILVPAVPPMGYSTILLEKVISASNKLTAPIKVTMEDFNDFMKGNGKAALNFGMAYYESHQEDTGRNSGAYIFRPKSQDPIPLDMVNLEQVSNAMVTEYRFQLDVEWASFIVRQYAGKEEYEVEWLVGPIPVEDSQGKEVIFRYDSETILNGDEFWTDSNGRQMIQRKRDQRTSFDFTQGDVDKEPTASNYYPVTTGIHLRDANSALTVLTDRSEGGSSLAEGQLELMLHRRCLKDDGFGVGEALDEEAFGEGLVVRGKHTVFLDTDLVNGEKFVRRTEMRDNYLQPTLLFAPQNLDADGFTANYPNKVFIGINEVEIPSNVNIVTLEQYGDNEGHAILRIEHLFEEGDSASGLSDPVNVNLENLFASFTVTGMVEMGLAGNVRHDGMSRFHWNTEEWSLDDHEPHHRLADEQGLQDDGLIIQLKPMEIRTFLLGIQRH